MDKPKPKYVKQLCEVCGVVYAVLKEQVGKTRHCPKQQKEKSE